jgi:hypothetical protein
MFTDYTKMNKKIHLSVLYVYMSNTAVQEIHASDNQCTDWYNK